MGTIYYQQDNDLDSLSNVSGFNSALNGVTYGLKKQGGIFIPDDISGGGGSISGIIPDSGLYLDGANRVGVQINANSGLDVNSTGLLVKQGNNVLVNENGVNVNKGKGFTADNTLLEIGAGDYINVNNNNISVKKGLGFTSSGSELNIGAGAGITVNSANVAVNIDNNTITVNGNNQIQANFGTVPSFCKMDRISLTTSLGFGEFPTLIRNSSGSVVFVTVPNNWGIYCVFTIKIRANIDEPTPDYIQTVLTVNNDSTLILRAMSEGYYIRGYSTGENLPNGNYITQQTFNYTATNKSGISEDISFSIKHSGEPSLDMEIISGIGLNYLYVYYFPVQPSSRKKYSAHYYV